MERLFPAQPQPEHASARNCVQVEGGGGRGCRSSLAVMFLLAADPETCGVDTQETVHQYKLLVSELEAVLPVSPLQRWADGGGSAGNGSAADPLRALPAAVQNLHDYLIHVAARLERLHEAVDRAKDVFLAALRKVRVSNAGHQSPIHQDECWLCGVQLLHSGCDCLR